MKDCIFCKIGRHQARSWMIAESDQAFAILDVHPMNRWHATVMPKDHYVNIFDIPITALQAVMATLKQVVSLYQERLGIDAVQIISSNGTLAQQDVFHLAHCTTLRGRWARYEMEVVSRNYGRL